MVAYKFQMPSGIAGNITRQSQSDVESRMLDQTTPPLLFGVPVKLVSNKMKPIEANDVASAIAGFIVRPYPTSGNGTDGLGAAVPNKGFPGDLLKRGYMNVAVNNYAVNAPVAQGLVYVRVANPSGVKVVGGIEAAADIGVTASATTGTGTSTAGTLSATNNTAAGAYKVTCESTSSTSNLDVLFPDGSLLSAVGKVGSQVTLANGLSFKITAGGTVTAGDFLTITVAANTVVVPGNTYFTGTTDSAGNAEIAYNI